MNSLNINEAGSIPTIPKKGIDWILFSIVLLLMLLSIAFVYSASASIAETRFGTDDKFFWNHSLRVLLGIFTLIIFSKIDYHFWQKFSLIGIILSFIPLILVFFVGSPIKGAYRWIYIGPINFQPSELAKFALVIHLASMLVKRKEFIKDFKLGMLPMLIWIVIICGMIALQPNFSSALVIYIICLTMMFIGNVNLYHLVILSLFSIIGGSVIALSAPYRFQRILSYLGFIDNPESQNNTVFQIQQALIAFGNGGIFGLGPGQSRQSHLFLPESYGDFIFSIIGEEYGFLGTIVILIFFCIIFYRGFKIAKSAPDLFGYYLSSGILITFAFYVIVNAGVNCGLLPTTGLPMPFISYGGTAVIFYSAAIGILLNISKQKKNSFD